MPQTEDYSIFLAGAKESARRWLFDDALPLWWNKGADHQGGGFRENIALDGTSSGKAVRLRVQARQTFVYAQAGAMGWTGPWQAAMRHGLSFMLAHYRRPDGLFRSTLDAADPRIDLYDQAFVMLALAHAYKAEGRPAPLLETAQAVMHQIDASLGLKDGGYLDGLPAQPVLRANPLMHLLEACLAWVAVGENGVFRQTAVALCTLAETRLINSHIGAVGECFSTGWAPLENVEDRSYEPGHQFEWAWLLLQAGTLLGTQTRTIALSLDTFARRFGVDSTRHVALFSVNEKGTPSNRKARLWAQTERLRASLMLAAEVSGDQAAHQAAAVESFLAIQLFLDVPVPGLWHEWMDEAGQFEAMASPASSLYHLMTGLGELLAPSKLAPAADMEQAHQAA